MDAIIKEYYEPFLKGTDIGLIVNDQLITLNNLEIDEELLEEILSLDPYDGPIIINEEEGIVQEINELTEFYSKICRVIKVFRENNKVNGAIKDHVIQNRLSELTYDLNENLFCNISDNKSNKIIAIDEIDELESIKIKFKFKDEDKTYHAVGDIILKTSLDHIIKTEIDCDFRAIEEIRSFNFKFQSMSDIYKSPLIVASTYDDNDDNKYKFVAFDINDIPEEYECYDLKNFVEYENDKINIVFIYHHINAFFDKEEIFQYSYVLKKALMEIMQTPKDLWCPSCQRKLKKVTNEQKNSLLKNNILQEYHLSPTSDEKIKCDLSKIYQCLPCQLYFVSKVMPK